MIGVRDLLRVAYWSACVMVGFLWVLSLTFIVLGVMGRYDFTFLIWLSLVLGIIGHLGRNVEALSFLWVRY